MTEESCTCGCSTNPPTESTESTDQCTCGCGGSDEKKSKEGAVA